MGYLCRGFVVAGTAILLLLPIGGAALTVPSAPELQAQLDAAVHRRDPVFTIPPGTYNFTTNNLEITGATALRVVAARVTLWFGATGARMPGVNISNCDRVNVSGPLTIDYYGLRHTRRGSPGITYNLLNSSDVTSEDITIVKAPFFSVTAFNGGGGHVFRRFHLPADTATDASGRPTDPWPHERDAFHFSDLRRGVVLEDSDAAGFGDVRRPNWLAHPFGPFVTRSLLCHPHTPCYALGPGCPRSPMPEFWCCGTLPRGTGLLQLAQHAHDRAAARVPNLASSRKPAPPERRLRPKYRLRWAFLNPRCPPHTRCLRGVCSSRKPMRVGC